MMKSNSLQFGFQQRQDVNNYLPGTGTTENPQAVVNLPSKRNGTPIMQCCKASD